MADSKTPGEDTGPTKVGKRKPKIEDDDEDDDEDELNKAESGKREAKNRG